MNASPWSTRPQVLITPDRQSICSQRVVSARINVRRHAKGQVHVVSSAGSLSCFAFSSSSRILSRTAFTTFCSWRVNLRPFRYACAISPVVCAAG